MGIPTASDSTASTQTSNAANPKIIIIGAGVSGIACAIKLLEYGFEDVQILEAEERIGGRINTILFGENVVDLGAQWCHGEKDNVVYELASKHNLLETSGEFDYQCIRSNREVLPRTLDSRLRRIVYKYDKTELKKSSASFGCYMTNLFFETLKKSENSDIDPSIANEFFENYKKLQSSLDAADTLEELSIGNNLGYIRCEGDQYLHWKDKGYMTYLRLLLKSDELNSALGVLEKHVQLSKAVTRIKWNSNNSNVEITCKDGEIVNADHVIVTVSLGVLKQQHMHLFEPQLPAENIRAIEGISFGTANKIFLEFSEPFWAANWIGFSLLWREEDLIEIRCTSRAWLEDIFGFYTINFQPKVLAGWIVGPNGRHMESLSKDEVLAGCKFLLRKFLSHEIPDIISIRATAWSKNVNFCGSYSYRSVVTDKLGVGARELSQPLTVGGDDCKTPIVQFAGEATSESHYSTVHGAVETGWREARVLGEFYGKLCN